MIQSGQVERWVLVDLALTNIVRFILQKKIRSKTKVRIEATKPTPYKRKALER